MGTLLAVLLAATAGDPLTASDPVHLTLELRAPDLAGMRAAIAAQQDPASPQFRRYLTPAQFGERFGASPALYERLTGWLASGGLSLETFPNRLVVEATGSAGQVEELLHVRLLHVAGGPASMHVPDRAPELPADLASQVLIISGLDSSHQHHRRIRDSFQNLTFGPQDLRRYYDLIPLLDAGFAGAGAQMIVLGVAETPENTADPVDVNYFYDNVSDSRAVFSMDVLPNPSDDFTGSGGRGEDELDVEMQTVGAPEATSVTLVMPPASEQFIAGPNEIVNNFPNATVVSTSWGDCEPQEIYGSPNEPAAMEQLVIQGVLEGMTWSAAAGDDGSDDCGNSSAPTVDFPGSMPEMLSLGGTQPQDAGWDANDAIPAYEIEQVWNEGEQGGAGGGGFSVIYPPPAYQSGLFPTSFWPAGYLPTYGRAVPDLALLAAPTPGVVVDDTWEDVIDIIGGTSVASPLSAGFLALVSDRLGCRLGDLHTALYAMGKAQFDGGPKVFHDITVGTNALDGVQGPDAGVGFDPASGWGSLDVTAFAAALPPCPPLDAGILSDAGQIDAGPVAPLTQDSSAYDPCADIDCQSPTVCQTLPEGPSRCAVACSDGDSSGCPTGTACAPSGGCVPGNPNGGQGAPCLTPVDCEPTITCWPAAYGLFANGYCASECGPGYANCPDGTLCDDVALTGQLCVTACDGGCTDPNDVCQPQPGVGNACLPPCQQQSDCDTLALGSTCNAATGVCQFLPDGGGGTTSTIGTIGSIGTTGTAGTTGSTTGSGASTGGATTSSTTTTSNSTGTTGGHATSTGTTGRGTTSGASTAAASTTTGSTGAGTSSGGCGCSVGSRGNLDGLLLGLAALALLPRRRRTAVVR